VGTFAYQLTDETFAIHSTQFPEEMPSKAEIFATNVTAQTAWVAGGWLGVAAGQLITDVRALALDYALPAMFTVLLALQLKTYVQGIVVLLTGLLSVVLLRAGIDQWNVIVATLLGATFGIIIEQWTKKSSS